MNALDRYRQIRTLGSGGMATVVLAEDTVLGRQVALKRLPAASDVTSISRLRREALLGASISHPNVVSIYDVVTPNDGHGDVVIVMEYIDGETLRARIEREGRLSPDAALPILSGAAEGLDAVHARGIVHRDVKPANILLARDGSVKVADLGIASVPDRTRITTVGQVLGSFSYMSPEQLEDATATPAIDVYALAAVAYEALSGARARPESTPIAVAHAIATQPPPDIRDVWPEAPQAVAEVLRAGMSREPERRPQSASLFVAELRTALNDSERTARTAIRPHRGEAAGAAAAGAAAGLAAGTAGAEAANAAAARPADPSRATPAQAPRRADPPAATPPPRRPAARPAGTGRPEDPDRGRSAWLIPVLLVLLLAIAGGAVALATSGSSGTSSSSTSSAPPPATSHSHSQTTSHTSSATTTASQSQSATTSSTSTTSPSNSSTSTPSTSSTPSAPTTTSGSASTPSGAVQSFYELAASHQYAAAWQLADPNFQNQLGGYNSFQSQQSGDRRITFHQARVTNQSGNTATVAIRTTSVRNDGTQQCAGTVDLARNGGSTWLLHQIAINCG